MRKQTREDKVMWALTLLRGSGAAMLLLGVQAAMFEVMHPAWQNEAAMFFCAGGFGFVWTMAAAVERTL